MTEAEFSGRVAVMERKLYRISFSILKNDADCKDAMQEATYRAWNNMPKLRDETRFEAWLTRILVNECKDIKRRAVRHPESELPEQIPAPEVDNSVSEALYSLDGKQRDSMALHYIDGYSVDEISAMFNVPSGTVKSWLHYGRKKLKTILIAVIIAALIIGAAIGISLNSTLLSNLFGGATPPEELQESVKHDVSWAEDKNVKLNIDELLFDANSLSVMWSVTSSRPEPVIYKISTLNITSGEMERGEVPEYALGVGGPCGDGEMGVLNAELGDYSVGPTMYGDCNITFDGVLPKEPITVEVGIMAFTSDLTPVLFDMYGLDDKVYLSSFYPEEQAVIESLSKNGQYPVSGIGYTNFQHDPAYIKAYEELIAQINRPDDSSSEAEWAAYDEKWEKIRGETAYIKSGLLDYLTSLTVSVTIDPKKAVTHSYWSIDGQNEFEFRDFTLSVNKLIFYPASIKMDFYFDLKSGARPDALLLLADENYDQIVPYTLSEEIVEDGVITGVRCRDAGYPVLIPEYINILATDRKTVAGEWNYRTRAVEVGMYPAERNLKALFDAAPECDKAVIRLVEHDLIK